MHFERNSLVTLIAASIALVPPVIAQEESAELTSAQRDELARIEAGTERALSQFDAITAQIDAEIASFTADCLNVIPSKTICDCLAENTPFGVDFMSYISMTSKEHEIRQTKISADDRAVFEGTMTARDQCAAHNDE